MTRATAIVATGQTDFRSKRLDVSIPELVRESVDRCLGQRDVHPDRVDAVVIGNMELFEGIHHPEQLMVAALQAAGKPVYKLNTGGTVGASVAVMCDYLVSSGMHDVVLGIGYEKQSEGDSQGNITTVGDPAWERSVMAGAIGNFAVMASQYLDRSNATPEHAAKVAVKARYNGTLNPHAHLDHHEVTLQEVADSRVLAWPVRLMDMCPSSDGAAAGLFVAEDLAPSMSPKPAWIASTSTAHDTQFMGDSPARLAEMRSLQTATRVAYERAGLTDPRVELDVCELYEPATYAELAMYENVGLCPMGEGGTLIEKGVTELGGELPVNPSGGVLCTNAVGATAMVRVLEAAMQVSGEAGAHQVDEARWALATGYGGNAWTEALILTSERP